MNPIMMPNPRNVSFNLSVNGGPPMNVVGLSQAQAAGRPYIEAGMKVDISDAATGEVIERHPARTA